MTCLLCHSSSETERTKEMCVPSARWMPLQRMQTKVPSVALAQRGPLAPQSAHSEFSGVFSSSKTIALLRSASEAMATKGSRER